MRCRLVAYLTPQWRRLLRNTASATRRLIVRSPASRGTTRVLCFRRWAQVTMRAHEKRRAPVVETTGLLDERMPTESMKGQHSSNGSTQPAAGEETTHGNGGTWPPRPVVFGGLLTPIEAAQYLRLDETAHSPPSAIRTLSYWRDKGDLKATKFARHVWFRKEELDRFLERKTEA